LEEYIHELAGGEVSAIQDAASYCHAHM